MSIMVQKSKDIIAEYEISSTYRIIEETISMREPSFAVVQVDDEDTLQSLKMEIKYKNGRANYDYGKKTCFGYSREMGSFPIIGSDPSQKISGCFEINCGAIVYYPNRMPIEIDQIRQFLSEGFVIYTTESFEDIIKEYSQKRKCIIVREYPSDNKPTILTGKPQPFESDEFMKQIIGGRGLK